MKHRMKKAKEQRGNRGGVKEKMEANGRIDNFEKRNL